MSDRIVITAVHCMTPLGLDAIATATAVRAGISALRLSDQFDDSQGEPILESCLQWLHEGASSDDVVSEDDPPLADDEELPPDEGEEAEEADEVPDAASDEEDD